MYARNTARPSSTRRDNNTLENGTTRYRKMIYPNGRPPLAAFVALPRSVGRVGERRREIATVVERSLRKVAVEDSRKTIRQQPAVYTGKRYLHEIPVVR